MGADVAEAAIEAYLERLQRHSVLTAEERRAILSIQGTVRRVPARRDLVAPGQQVGHAILVAEGLLCRFDLMRDGARQITALHLEGDLCDLHSLVAPKTGWGINALTPAVVVEVPHDTLRRLFVDHPNLAMAFWRDATLDASILAKWIGNIGRKRARAGLAHLLCELGTRMSATGRSSRASYALPLTQEQIADCIGLTPVHVNRVMRALREDGIVTVADGQVTIHDWESLEAAADFSATYLLPYRTSHLGLAADASAMVE